MPTRLKRRIHAGLTQDDREAQRDTSRHVGRQKRESGIAGSAKQGVNGKDPARRKAGHQPGDGEAQSAQDETEQNGVGQRADIGREDSQVANQVTGRAVGGIP